MSIPVKPLHEVMKPPQPSKSAKVGDQTKDVLAHSRHSERKNKDYHAVILGGSGRRAIEELNPDETIPAHRMFPGLANG